MAQSPPVVQQVPAAFQSTSTEPALKTTCAPNGTSLAASPTCPVLVLNGYTYWALSYIDNRHGMAIVAVDSSGKVAKMWEKIGARYLWNIVVDENRQTVTFVGQSDDTISMSWQELAVPTKSGALSVAQISSRALECLLIKPCGNLPPTETSANFTIPEGISGFAMLTTRTMSGSGTAAAAGKFAYAYRVDMRAVLSSGEVPCVTDVAIDVGPMTPLKYDGVQLEDTFVISQDTDGTIGILSATRNGNVIDFTFDQPVCAGATPGKGQASQFFGLTSAFAPKVVSANVGWPGTLGIRVGARAPNHP